MAFTLRELDARFLGHIATDGRSYREVESLAEAQGVMFQCPKCAVGAKRSVDGGFMGVHSVLCWFKDRGVSDEVSPKPGRWIPSGSSLDDLTFVGPGAASVLLTGGCGWHGFVTNGKAE